MPSLYESYQQRKGGSVTTSTSSGTLFNSYQQRKESLKNFKQPEQKKVSKVSAEKPEFKNINDESKGFIQGTKKFLARTGVQTASLLTSALDFTASFIVDNPIFRKQQEISIKTAEKVFGKESKVAKSQKERVNKWKDVYNKITNTTTKARKGWEFVQQSDYIKPSNDWTKATLKEKLTKRLGETLSVLGPSIAPSFVLYALNPVAGVMTTITSTANDVKVSAIENGVDRDKAERLGLGTGILVGALDRIVPDELFSPGAKSKFIQNFIKRIVVTSIKEASTEIVQEDIQLAAEATFREDLGWDEVKTRNAMSALGGLLGGAGATTIVGTINQSFNQDILLEQTPKTEEKVSKVTEPVVKEGTNVVKVTEEPVVGKKLKIVEEPKQPLKTGVERGSLFEEAGTFVPEEQLKWTPKKQIDMVAEGIKPAYAEDYATLADARKNIKYAKDKGLLVGYDKYKRAYVAKTQEVLNRVVESGNKGAGIGIKLNPAVEREHGLALGFEDVGVLPTQPKGVGGVKVKPKKVVEVPKQQLPVGEGKKIKAKPKKITRKKLVKTTKLSKGVKSKAIKNKLIYGFDKRFRDLPDYDVAQVNEQRTKAIDLVLNNTEEALDIAMGNKKPPSNVLPESVFVAMEEYAIANKDVETIRRLATESTLTGEATLMGQRIRMLAERNPESPVGIIREVVKKRTKKFQEKFRNKTVKQAQSQVVENIKKQVKSPDRKAWNSFLNSIEC